MQKEKTGIICCFLVAVTVLHESVHYEYFTNGLTAYDGGEEGNAFEKDAYGEVILRMNKKRVMDNWLNNRPIPNPFRPNPDKNKGNGQKDFWFDYPSGNFPSSPGKKTDSIYHPHKFRGKE